MENIFSNPVSVLMTINGSLNKPINLEMLCATISPRSCKKAEIIKFIGFNKIYFYDPEYSQHSDDNKYFYNQCSFEFKNKITIKLFSNGTYIITGCTDEENAKKYLTSMITIISTKKYIYLPKCISDELVNENHVHNRLSLVYNLQGCTWNSCKIALANYSISLHGYEFNKYKVIHIVDIIDNELEKQQIESITDIFKYSSVSIKLRNINGNIDIYKNKVIISIQTAEHYDILLNFFNKYKYKLISLPVSTTVSKLIFLNSIFTLKKQEDKKCKFEMPKKINNITNNIIEKIQNI